MKTRLFAAVALGAMTITAGSALAMSLQNDRDHDGGPRSFSGAVSSGGQNLVLPYAATEPRIDVTQPVIGTTGTVNAKTGGFSLQNERSHDGSFRN